MKSTSLALAAPLLALFASPATAGINLVTNGSFEMTSVMSKARFAGKVAGWGGGSKLTFIDFPGSADNGVYLSVWGPFANHSPDGGKFVEADGDPSFRSAITQTISGLTVGQVYRLHFWQAAGQQAQFSGPTTERWAVSFGSDTTLSQQYTLASHGVGAWQRQTMDFTAHATSQVLSFLASGTPNGAPPISFLDGVSLMSGAPEPASWALMLGGFGLVGAALRRREAIVA